MRVLVAFATTDGHTRKVAAFVAQSLHDLGSDVDCVELRRGAHSPDPRGYDAIILAASVHASGYQRAVVRWATAHAADLNGRHTAFVSVCLGVLQHDPLVDRALADIRDRLFRRTGWYPAVTEVVAGALLYTQYNWFKRMLMLRIVRKAGGDTDTTRDYEYTDWTALRNFARAFHYAGTSRSEPVQPRPFQLARK